jgi:hypothetical protein
VRYRGISEVQGGVQREREMRRAFSRGGKLRPPYICACPCTCNGYGFNLGSVCNQCACGVGDVTNGVLECGSSRVIHRAHIC